MMSSESAVRSLARRHGYRVRKSRRVISLDNFGLYMLVDAEQNAIVLGERFDADLADIEAFFKD